MKAITVNVDQKDSLLLEEVERPVIGTDEVLIKVVAAALNHRDLYMNEQWQALKGYGKFIAGGDAAGVIVELGHQVVGWEIGQEVIINPLLVDDGVEGIFPEFLGGPTNGTFAEFVKAPAKYILKKPSYLSFDEAAALPLALSTAWGNVVTQGKLKEGETLLLQGVGGGVALFILQLAVKRGIKVIVTSSSDKKIEQALDMGAVYGINYRSDNVIEKVMEFTKGNGVDVAIDGAGKDAIESSIYSLGKNGRLLVFGSASGAFNWERLENINHQETGMVPQAELEEALRFYEKHQIHPVLSEKVYHLENYLEAYQEIREGRQFGKVILRIS